MSNIMTIETEAAGRIMDIMTGGKFDWRSRIDRSDFLESTDWQCALSYARAALKSGDAQSPDRGRFEAWVKSRGGDTMKRDGHYVSSMGRLWWDCWQAALAHPVAAWRPIETAPRDGRRILATGGGLEDTVEVASYNGRVGAWNTENYTLDDRDNEAEGYSRPSHWQPMPPSTAVAVERPKCKQCGLEDGACICAHIPSPVAVEQPASPAVDGETLKLADKIESWTPENRQPLTLIARERRLAVSALRALTSRVSAPVACEQCDYADMLWKWFGSEERCGAEYMRHEMREGLDADEFKTMLDEHEAALAAPSSALDPATVCADCGKDAPCDENCPNHQTQEPDPNDREIRTGAHVLQMAKSFGWKDDGEGALEFILRFARQVAFEDCGVNTSPVSQTSRAEGGLCTGGFDPGWDECPKCGATSDDECRVPSNVRAEK